MVVTKDPRFKLMQEEIFGPVVTVFVYEDAQIEETLELVDTTSPYALTGAIFAQDRKAVDHLSKALRHTAGNFYINDKPTGAVVGQQPFGGARASGTNDKAGSMANLMRWTSQRAIKENLRAGEGLPVSVYGRGVGVPPGHQCPGYAGNKKPAEAGSKVSRPSREPAFSRLFFWGVARALMPGRGRPALQPAG